MLKHQTFHQLHQWLNDYSITWPLRSRDTSWRRIGGISWPLSLFRAGWLLWTAMVDLNFLLKPPSSFTCTFTSGEVYLWPVVEVTAELGCFRYGRVGMLPVNVFFESHPYSSNCFTNTTTFHTVHHTVSLSGSLSLGLTNRDLRVLKALWYEGTPWDLNTLWSCSDMSEI